MFHTLKPYPMKTIFAEENQKNGQQACKRQLTKKSAPCMLNEPFGDFCRSLIQKKGGIMKLSARNQLKGKVTEVKLGQIVGEVVLDIGGQRVTSVITRDAIEEMGVKVGDEVSAVIKSTEIMLLKA